MRFLFYADWTPAVPYLEPIYRYMEQEGHDCYFYISDVNEFNAALKEKLEPQGIRFTDDPNKRVDWAFCADPRSACPTPKRINVFHGVSSKSQDFSRVHRQGARGIHAVASEWFADLFQKYQGVNSESIIIGGLSKWDPFEEVPPLRKENPKVLYLPTHNADLSAINVLGDSINEIEHTEHRHHAILAQLQTVTTSLDCCFGEDRSRSMDNLLWDADIVIADMGSTVIEAIALGKMTIQVRTQAATDFHHKRGTSLDEFLNLPEVYWPMRYGFGAENIDDIKRIIQLYPDFLDEEKYPRPDTTIIDNIGHYQVSKVLHDYVTRKR